MGSRKSPYMAVTLMILRLLTTAIAVAIAIAFLATFLIKAYATLNTSF